MVDRLIDYWESHGYVGSGKKLLLNQDNGPKNSSRRTQFIKRLEEFSIDYDVEITLVYYPPYHSKYNPILFLQLNYSDQSEKWGIYQHSP